MVKVRARSHVKIHYSNNSGTGCMILTKCYTNILNWLHLEGCWVKVKVVTRSDIWVSYSSRQRHPHRYLGIKLSYILIHFCTGEYFLLGFNFYLRQLNWVNGGDRFRSMCSQQTGQSDQFKTVNAMDFIWRACSQWQSRHDPLKFFLKGDVAGSRDP